MTSSIIFFFSVAALAGLTMAWKISKGREVSTLLILTHGTAAFLGVATLAADVWYQTEQFRLYFGYMALGFFGAAAVLGLIMRTTHYLRGAPRPVFIIFHIFMALTAIFFLTAYLAPA